MGCQIEITRFMDTAMKTTTSVAVLCGLLIFSTYAFSAERKLKIKNGDLIYKGITISLSPKLPEGDEEILMDEKGIWSFHHTTKDGKYTIIGLKRDFDGKPTLWFYEEKSPNPPLLFMNPERFDNIPERFWEIEYYDKKIIKYVSMSHGSKAICYIKVDNPLNSGCHGNVIHESFMYGYVVALYFIGPRTDITALIVVADIFNDLNVYKKIDIGKDANGNGIGISDVSVKNNNITIKFQNSSYPPKVVDLSDLPIFKK